MRCYLLLLIFLLSFQLSHSSENELEADRSVDDSKPSGGSPVQQTVEKEEENCENNTSNGIALDAIYDLSLSARHDYRGFRSSAVSNSCPSAPLLDDFGHVFDADFSDRQLKELSGTPRIGFKRNKVYTSSGLPPRKEAKTNILVEDGQSNCIYGRKETISGNLCGKEDEIDQILSTAGYFQRMADLFKGNEKYDVAAEWYMKAGDKYAEDGLKASVFSLLAASLYKEAYACYLLEKDYANVFISLEKSGEQYELCEALETAGDIFDEGAQLSDRLLDAGKALYLWAKSGQVYARGNYHLKAGKVYYAVAQCYAFIDVYLAVDWYMKSIKYYQLGGQLEILGDIYVKVSKCYDQLSNLDEAIKWLEKAGDIYINVENHEKAAYICFKVADKYEKKGEHEKAIIWHENSALEYEVCEEQEMVGDNFFCIAGCYAQLKNYRAAIKFFFKSVGAYEDEECHVKVGITYSHIATFYSHQLHDYKKAAELYLKLAAYYLEPGKNFWNIFPDERASSAYLKAGRAKFKLGEYQEAMKLFSESEVLFGANGRDAYCHWQMAKCYKMLKMYNFAAQWFLKSGEAYVSVHKQENAGISFKNAAVMYYMAGVASKSAHDAISDLLKGANLFLKINRDLDVAKCYLTIAKRYLMLDMKDEAAGYFHQAAKGFERNDKFELAFRYYRKSKLLYVILKNSLPLNLMDKTLQTYDYLIAETTVSQFYVRLLDDMEEILKLEITRQRIIEDLVQYVLPMSRNPQKELGQRMLSVQFEGERASGGGVLVELFMTIANLVVKGEDEDKCEGNHKAYEVNEDRVEDVDEQYSKNGSEAFGENKNETYMKKENENFKKSVKKEPYFILSEDQQVYVPNPERWQEADLLVYEVLGVFLALGVHLKQQLPLPLAQAVWGCLLSFNEEKVFTLEDIKDYNTHYYMALQNILKNDLEIGETMSYQWCGKPLGNQPDDIVTNDNKIAFVRDVLDEIWRDKRQQIMRMGIGFKRTINRKLLGVLSPAVLGMLLVGKQSIDVEKWKKVTEIEGYSKDADIIQWFWKIVEEMEPEGRVALLQFWSARRSLPVGGFSALHQPFKIKRTMSGLNFFPSAVTCFFILNIPEYTSAEMLKEKISIALDHREWFGYI